MDDADIAGEREDRFRAAAIANALRAYVTAKPQDHCRNCADPLDPVRRAAGFCGTDCRDDWVKREDARRRQGQAPAAGA
jgi:hypothetical protein